MAIALLDALSLRANSRWHDFIDAIDEEQPYIAHVGAGWALARLPWHRYRPETRIMGYDRLLRWLLIDGFGFHEGYFFLCPKTFAVRKGPLLSPYGKRAYDQGLGRSLWFTCGADISRLPTAIAAFSEERRPDLWSGIGLACAYAGGMAEESLDLFVSNAAPHSGHLKQGIAFGVEARKLAGIDTEATHYVCERLCLRSVDQVSSIVRSAKAEASTRPDAEDLPAYELWRTKVRNQLEGVAA
jgi:hypothetical protein